jgi:hypothetical protein
MDRWCESYNRQVDVIHVDEEAENSAEECFATAFAIFDIVDCWRRIIIVH